MPRRKSNIIDTMIPATIAGRYATHRYFASNQSLIFIGPYLLDEALACSYKIEQRKVPIYGYASQYYDTVASGKIIVSGTLTVNYIDSMYLSLALVHGLAKNAGDSNTYKAVLDASIGGKAKGRQITQLLGKIPSASLDGNNSLNSKDMRDVAQLIATDPLGGTRVIKALRDRYWRSGSSTDDHAFGGQMSPQGLQDFFSNQDASQQFLSTLGSRPDQIPPINITVSHGNPMEKNSSYRVLHDVDFISTEQMIGPTGQPQSETYSFIARSVGF